MSEAVAACALLLALGVVKATARSRRDDDDREFALSDARWEADVVKAEDAETAALRKVRSQKRSRKRARRRAQLALLNPAADHAAARLAIRAAKRGRHDATETTHA